MIYFDISSQNHDDRYTDSCQAQIHLKPNILTDQVAVQPSILASRGADDLGLAERGPDISESHSISGSLEQENAEGKTDSTLPLTFIR